MPDTRASGYAELLAALLAVRSDPATARFDAELAAAEARGDLDGATARTLRWWQRESLRGLSDHLSRVLPHLLDDLAAASAEAVEAVDESAAAWDAASAAPAGHGQAAVAVPLPEPTAPATGPGSTGPVHLRPVDDSLTGAPEGGTTTSGADLPPAPPRVLRPGFAPPEQGPSAISPEPPGAARPRLLVSGITVRGEGASPLAGPALSSRPADPHA